jgi:AAA+ ATPase superfamily predicted ATPase
MGVRRSLHMFVDRDWELAFLKRAWASHRAELLVVYGRHVGKTALLRQFCLGARIPSGLRV